MKPWPYPRWIAHRGAGLLAPENTLAAFRLGAAYGYRMFECDARLSADGKVFLLHDDTLARTTSGHGIAGDLTWTDLAALDAGGWHSPAYSGEPLPALADLARWCLAAGHSLNIEIKPGPGMQAQTGEAVAREAARLWAGQPVAPLLSSFSAEALASARQTAAQLPRALLLDALAQDWLAMAKALECVAVVFHWPLCNAKVVRQVKDAGMRCLGYTVNETGPAQGLIALGIDGLITDRVDLFSPD